jgi:hypothetical protein
MKEKNFKSILIKSELKDRIDRLRLIDSVKAGKVLNTPEFIIRLLDEYEKKNEI